MIAIYREFYCADFNWAKAVSSFFDVEHLRHPLQRALWLASLVISEPVRNVVRFEQIACADPENLAGGNAHVMALVIYAWRTYASNLESVSTDMESYSDGIK